VEKARNAMHEQGFFYVVNHGLDRAQVRQDGHVTTSGGADGTRCSVERIFDIAAVPFEQGGAEEKS